MARNLQLEFIGKWIQFIPNSRAEEFGLDVGHLTGNLMGEMIAPKGEKPCFCGYELTPVMCPTHGVLNGG